MQHKIRLKLQSGKYATGLLDTASSKGYTRSIARANIKEFMLEVEDNSTEAVDRESLGEVIDKTLADPKYRNIIAVYGISVY